MTKLPTFRRSRARGLRRDSSEVEKRLWSRLRNRQLGGYKFVRQEPIGPFYADFVCREHNLIVELDGGQHADNVRDLIRDGHLAANGYRVVRFWNNEVMENLEGVLETLLAILSKNSCPSPGSLTRSDLSPQAGRGNR
jgi:very-short-patch-repair endonuclease